MAAAVTFMGDPHTHTERYAQKVHVMDAVRVATATRAISTVLQWTADMLEVGTLPKTAAVLQESKEADVCHSTATGTQTLADAHTDTPSHGTGAAGHAHAGAPPATTVTHAGWPIATEAARLFASAEWLSWAGTALTSMCAPTHEPHCEGWKPDMALQTLRALASAQAHVRAGTCVMPEGVREGIRTILQWAAPGRSAVGFSCAPPCSHDVCRDIIHAAAAEPEEVAKVEAKIRGRGTDIQPCAFRAAAESAAASLLRALWEVAPPSRGLAAELLLSAAKDLNYDTLVVILQQRPLLSDVVHATAARALDHALQVHARASALAPQSEQPLQRLCAAGRWDVVSWYAEYATLDRTAAMQQALKISLKWGHFDVAEKLLALYRRLGLVLASLFLLPARKQSEAVVEMRATEPKRSVAEELARSGHVEGLAWLLERIPPQQDWMNRVSSAAALAHRFNVVEYLMSHGYNPASDQCVSALADAGQLDILHDLGRRSLLSKVHQGLYLRAALRDGAVHDIDVALHLAGHALDALADARYTGEIDTAVWSHVAQNRDATAVMHVLQTLDAHQIQDREISDQIIAAAAARDDLELCEQVIARLPKREHAQAYWCAFRSLQNAGISPRVRTWMKRAGLASASASNFLVPGTGTEDVRQTTLGIAAARKAAPEGVETSLAAAAAQCKWDEWSALLCEAGPGHNAGLHVAQALSKYGEGFLIARASLAQFCKCPEVLCAAASQHAVGVIDMALSNAAPDDAFLDALDATTGMNALHVAAQAGCASVLRRLIAAGASPSLRTREGKTAADLLVEKGFTLLARWFGWRTGTLADHAAAVDAVLAPKKAQEDRGNRGKSGATRAVPLAPAVLAARVQALRDAASGQRQRVHTAIGNLRPAPRAAAAAADAAAGQQPGMIRAGVRMIHAADAARAARSSLARPVQALDEAIVIACMAEHSWCVRGPAIVARNRTRSAIASAAPAEQGSDIAPRGSRC